MPDMKGAMTELMEENKRLKARVKMLRKLRSQMLILVRQPNGGNDLGVFTIPFFVYAKNAHKANDLVAAFLRDHNQELSFDTPVICDTWAGLLSELDGLNQNDSPEG